MNDSNHTQVVRMLEAALADAVAHGAVGLQLVLTTRDGVSSYKYVDPPDGDMAEMLWAAPCDGACH